MKMKKAERLVRSHHISTPGGQVDASGSRHLNELAPLLAIQLSTDVL